MIIEVKQFYSFCVCQLLLIGFLNNGNKPLVVEYETVLSRWDDSATFILLTGSNQGLSDAEVPDFDNTDTTHIRIFAYES